MTLLEAIQARHSVRAYKDIPLPEDVARTLREAIETANREGGLHIQLVLDEPKAFAGPMSRYGRFRGVSDYLVVAGRKDDSLDGRAGYYGQRIVLLAQTLGLNTCWVGLNYSKIPGTYALAEDEKIVCYIALGYGQTQGGGHKVRTVEEVSNAGNSTPQWFIDGVRAALLAPTAVNQQKFRLEYVQGNQVAARTLFSVIGYTALDLGIVKYNFEVGAGKTIEWI